MYSDALPRYTRQPGSAVREKHNSCITLHQPWASLLVHGIKRIEGRTWSCPMRGRLWIHAASKIPERETIEAMEEFYRQAYALDGVNDVNFPEHYPTSVLLGCVEVVGCLYKEEVENWDEVSAGLRIEAQTEFCWLCEDPQKLVIPLEMRGRQSVYPLDKRMLSVAPRGLRHAQGPAPVTFPSLDRSDPFSLQPGCLRGIQNMSGKHPVESSPKLGASVAAARAAALQFRKQDGPPNLEKLSTQFGQNTLDDSMDKRERGKTLQDNLGAPSSGSMPINASRQAPHRVAACRIFDQAMGALSRRGPNKV